MVEDGEVQVEVEKKEKKEKKEKRKKSEDEPGEKSVID